MVYESIGNKSRLIRRDYAAEKRVNASRAGSRQKLRWGAACGAHPHGGIIQRFLRRTRLSIMFEFQPGFALEQFVDRKTHCRYATEYRSQPLVGEVLHDGGVGSCR